MTTPPTALRAFRATPALPAYQVRHATLLRRPKRPYTFTQLMTLSDGSSFTVRTTSPVPVYKSAKDIRNNPLWHPSSQKLLNVEEDEAGRLAAFRAKFGRGWDSEGDDVQAKDGASGDKTQTQPQDHLLDLISAHSKARQPEPKAKAPAKAPAKK